MRLINADKTKNSLWGFERYTGIDEMPIEYAEEIIDKQPTVEAIPIEWMKKFANERALNDGPDDYWHFWGTDLLQMIELWEKENEKQTVE